MQEINALNTRQASIQEAIRATKQEATEVKDQVAQLTFKNETLAQDANVIRSQIVSSPARIKAEVVSKGERLNTEQGSPMIRCQYHCTHPASCSRTVRIGAAKAA
jgi:uncharacterized coiled-coil DUF342 family protein